MSNEQRRKHITPGKDETYKKPPLHRAGVRLFLCLLPVLAILAVLSSLSIQAAPIRTVTATITKISDGDTVQAVTTEGTKLKIRLYGIDAPETQKGKITGEPFSNDSRNYLTTLVSQRSVRIEIRDIDRYRRMVAILWLEEQNVNLETPRRDPGDCNAGRLPNRSLKRARRTSRAGCAQSMRPGKKSPCEDQQGRCRALGQRNGPATPLPERGRERCRRRDRAGAEECPGATPAYRLMGWRAGIPPGGRQGENGKDARDVTATPWPARPLPTIICTAKVYRQNFLKRKLIISVNSDKDEENRVGLLKKSHPE